MVLIMSWNVAGLSTTLNRIHEHYKKDEKETDTINNKNKQNQASSSLKHYFAALHAADIICLQEHKIPQVQVANRYEPFQCATAMEGFESFWSFNNQSAKNSKPGGTTSKASKGMNGVMTYCKKGLVTAADPHPFFEAPSRPDHELNSQGRCIVTHHGTAFTLINVYVPCSGGHALSDKMRFLYALEDVMERQSNPIILLGDLNITCRGRDRHWADRTVLVNEIIEEVLDDDSPSWKRQVQRAWPKIKRALATKHTVPTQTTNPKTGETFEKYRLAVHVDDKDGEESGELTDSDNEEMSAQQDGSNRGNGSCRRVFLGNYEPSPHHCLYFFDFDSRVYTCPRSQEEKVARTENAISLGILAELMQKIAGITWSVKLQRDEIAQELVEKDGGGVDPLHPPRQWFTRYLLQQRKMVDVFAHFYPHAEGRYTCWNQFTNRRYDNEGTRIDYTLVDPSLLPMTKIFLPGSLPSNDCPLRCACRPDNTDERETTTSASKHLPQSLDAALCAATANGAYQPASFEGGGLSQNDLVPQRVLDLQFNGTPHTGIVYTPPTYSDHIAITLLLQINTDKNDNEVSFSKGNLELKNDRLTRQAQPHKQQASIASFFTTNSSTATKAKRLGPTRIASKRPKAATMQSYFATKKAKTTDTNEKTKRQTVKATRKPKPNTNSILHHFAKR